ncbi:phytoene desaturase [Chitinophaga pendula]|uniref:phytoene desaturase family protein n=1 Tax=Chitinophaga TaxID=79328 RepID=UPI000BB04D3C|nr:MULTISPECIES: phytoene desaturase family protein [Chitinophaga]ASZ12108.1 phytoene dehydrogenase [Chitinophaga sp. MD30]UCJ04856.1 phytoene desaturase [Chitinophaga pendula]
MHVSIIGAGIAGMVSACYLRKEGYNVTVIDKNDLPGGRARSFSAAGFQFDMGPSWYWMPDVFENFFADFGRKSSDYYNLIRLDPSYQVYFDNKSIKVPAGAEAVADLFEQMEEGAGRRLERFLSDAKTKYDIGMNRFANRPSLNFSEYLSTDTMSAISKLQLLRSMKGHVSRYFRHPLLRQIMQFPVIFLGAMPSHIPAMYSLMNHADTGLGTWYPNGGMYKIVEAVFELATLLGVQFKFGEDATSIRVEGKLATGVATTNNFYETDLVVGAGDYHYMEQLLPEASRQYSQTYWASRQMAPSCLLYYVGVKKKLPLAHHSLFFDTSFEAHASALYDHPCWPEHPLFYVCAPSVTDHSVAPEGCENLFILIPVAAGMQGDNQQLRDDYFNQTMRRLEQATGVSIADHIIYRKSYGITDFSHDYHAYKGNAYGLANTLRQTAFGKPRLKSRKVNNLIFAGQLTVPGPGLPPAFLSGKMAALTAIKHMQQVSASFPSSKLLKA